MNDDNDESRRAVEHCYRTHKTMVNPIVDWTDEDVWEFLNSNNIQHCCLYDEGFKRLGCIGCPLSGSKNMERDFERWPKYKDMYIRAFQHMIDNHPGEIKILDPNAETKFKLEVNDAKSIGGGYSAIGSKRAIDECGDADGSDGTNAANPHNTREREREREREYSTGLLQDSGGCDAVVHRRLELKPSSDSSSATATDCDAEMAEIYSWGGTSLDKPCWSDGRKLLCAEYLFDDWRTHDGTTSRYVWQRISECGLPVRKT